MNRRDFIATTAMGAAALAFPPFAASEEPDLKPIWTEIEKRHDESVPLAARTLTIDSAAFGRLVPHICPVLADVGLFPGGSAGL